MMQNRRLLFVALPALAAVALAIVPPAFAQSTVIIAPTAPPAVRVEMVPPAPSTTMIWQPGHWAYADNNWNWIPGQYAAPPPQMAVWDPGHWVQQPTGGYAWVEGRWRTSGG
jgi:hypothetical protein